MPRTSYPGRCRTVPVASSARGTPPSKPLAIDPRQVRVRPKPWIAADLLRELQRRYRAARNGTGKVSLPIEFHQPAKRLFGSLRAAIAAAGLDPATIHLCRPPWTREQILELIRRRVAAGLSLATGSVKPGSAVPAARRLFGSWRQAQKAAGVAIAPARPPWTEVSVIEAILTRQEAGKPLHTAAVIVEAPRLYVAGGRWFGGWYKALSVAGIDPASVRKKHAPYTRDDVIQTLRRRAKEEKNICQPGRHSESFRKAAKRLFGSWQNALDAAGVAMKAARKRRS